MNKHILIAPKVLAKPNPLPLSNHFTRAGSSGNAALDLGVNIFKVKPTRSGHVRISGRLESRALRQPGTAAPCPAPINLDSRALSATELCPKLRSTLACNKISGPPSSATTNPNPFTGSNHLTRPFTRLVGYLHSIFRHSSYRTVPSPKTLTTLRLTAGRRKCKKRICIQYLHFTSREFQGIQSRNFP